MWYKFVNRTCDQLRVFRTINLKFNQDQIGMFRFRTLSKTTDLLFRLSRSEGTLRGFSIFFLFGALSSVLYLKSTYYDPVYVAPQLAAKKKDEQEKDKLARQILFYNNLGAPTKPSRSMNEFFAFLESSQAINRTFEFIDYALDLNTDQQAGLDSYSSQTDQRLLDLIVESKKKKGGH